MHAGTHARTNACMHREREKDRERVIEREREPSKKIDNLESSDLGLSLIPLIKSQDGHFCDVSDGLLVGCNPLVQLGNHVIEGGSFLDL